MQLSQQKINLLGLPGSGKSRVANALQQQFNCAILPATEKEKLAGSIEWHDWQALPAFSWDEKVWCVIDIRSKLEQDWAQQILTALISISDGVVFAFAEQADLDNQAWWQQWLKKAVKELGRETMPTTRCFYGQLNVGFNGFPIAEERQSADVLLEKAPKWTQRWSKEQAFEFTVGKVVLDHLLMGLDNSMRNLDMKVTRIQALLETLEFDNLIELHGTVNRLDKFGLDINENFGRHKLGKIKIKGYGLDRDWLEQIINASSI